MSSSTEESRTCVVLGTNTAHISKTFLSVLEKIELFDER